jgi:hypothetical protein
MNWILIIFVHASVLSKGDSMSITNVPGFKTEAACMAAGKKAEDLTKNTTKDTKFVCVKQD